MNNEGTNFHPELAEGDVIGIRFSAIQHAFVPSVGNCLPFSMESNQPLPLFSAATLTQGVLSSTDQGEGMDSQWAPTPWLLTDK